MYTIVKAQTARMSKVDENQHILSLIESSDVSDRSLVIIEAAEITEQVLTATDHIYYVLDGVMTIGNEKLKKGDCCFIPQGETVVITGTFRALSFS